MFQHQNPWDSAADGRRDALLEVQHAQMLHHTSATVDAYYQEAREASKRTVEGWKALYAIFDTLHAPLGPVPAERLALADRVDQVREQATAEARALLTVLRQMDPDTWEAQANAFSKAATPPSKEASRALAESVLAQYTPP